MSAKQKTEYLLGKGLKFSQGENSFEVNCEVCDSILSGWLRFSKYRNVYDVSMGGSWYYDAVGGFHIYCLECIKRIRDWDRVKKWLKETGKTKNFQ